MATSRVFTTQVARWPHHGGRTKPGVDAQATNRGGSQDTRTQKEGEHTKLKTTIGDANPGKGPSYNNARPPAKSDASAAPL